MDNLTEAQREEAERIARIAQRAEQRARAKNKPQAQPPSSSNPPTNAVSQASDANGRPRFMSKKQREKLALERLERQRREQGKQREEERFRLEREREARILEDRKRRREEREQQQQQKQKRSRTNSRRDDRDRDRDRGRDRRSGSNSNRSRVSGGGDFSVKRELEDEMSKPEVLAKIKESYLGSRKELRKKAAMTNPSVRGKGQRFKFEWDASDDTSHDLNPLYANPVRGSVLFGGNVAGVDALAKKDRSLFLSTIIDKRYGQQGKRNDTDADKIDSERRQLERMRDKLRGEESARSARKEKMSKNWREKTLEEMTPRDWRIVREDHDIYVKGKRVDNPARNWDELDLSRTVRAAIDRLGYKRPSAIQMQAIPIGLRQRDIIGVAETGSGKTAAFVIPLLEYLGKQSQATRDACAEEGPLSVIMAPTRELAQQIAQEAERLAFGGDARVVCVVGGNSIEDQGFLLRKGCDIVVATPGRLLDCLENRYVVFNQCSYIVLDEADTMIDMGFEPQVEAVLNNMVCATKSTKEAECIEQEKLVAAGSQQFRTTIMFSATMPQSVEALAKKYLRFPAIVKIGDKDSGKNQMITQEVYYLSHQAKEGKLRSLIKRTRPPVIVFSNQKDTCNALSKMLERNGTHVCVLHSGKMQAQREASLKGFRDGDYDVLVATDVAGRGLDIDNVQHVINYDMATTIERYTHRIGRTGRAGKTGLASTLLTEDDNALFYELKQYLKSTKAKIPRELDMHPMSKIRPGDYVDKKEVEKQLQKIRGGS